MKEELRTANWLNKPYDMELSVKGPIVSNRSIPLNFFSSLTSIIQNIYLEISYDPFYFNERSVGFLNKCDGDDQFHLKSVTGSSIALLLPIKSEVILSPQSELYAQLSYEEGFFMHLLTIGHLDKIYIEDMSPKLLRYYIQLLKLLVKTGATLSTRTKFHPFKISFTPKWARIRLKKINKVLDKKN
ncbi:MAG: hypothetical protein LBR53_07365 [Deltaproteobacteria bacterium]|nr:hypothetical protein [Deltaproteobacteria bacterium]